MVRNLKQFETDHLLKNKKKKTSGDIENCYYCMVCVGKYDGPPRKDCIMRFNCKFWTQVKCSSGENPSKCFICVFCT